MGFIKGSLSLTRYRVLDAPPELSDEYLAERLGQNAFVDIEHSPEERSLGWVEFLNHLSSSFNAATFRFGGLLVFTLRLDTRKLSPRTLARYLAIRQALYVAETGRQPHSLAKKQLKEAVRSDLLRRCLVNTELMEVVWLWQEKELWLAAAGEKRREAFEELWNRTFGLSLQMLVPATLGLELLNQELHRALLDCQTSPIWIG